MFGSITRFIVEPMLRSLDDASVVTRGSPHHHWVLDAIKRRDPDAASTAMRDHIELGREIYGGDLEVPLETIAHRKLGDLFDHENRTR